MKNAQKKANRKPDSKKRIPVQKPDPGHKERFERLFDEALTVTPKAPRD